MVVGFAGAGNMAGAIARGIARGQAPPAMLFTDSGSGRAQKLADELGGERVETLEELADRSDVVVLAVKPAGLEAVAPQIAGRTAAVASVLGATSLARLQAALAPTPVLRTMPNIAVEIGSGIVCHAPVPAGVPEIDEFLGILSGLGSVVELPEEQLDAATAVMGCAPAYVALAAGAIADAGVEAGLDPELSGRLVREAIEGVGRHLAELDPGPMQVAIASPGGSTEAGLDVLADRDVAAAFAAAVRASLERMEGKR
ncbi:MAG: pyrroline-5-carboxylate reductase dimerization domain-containing protein [Solirubrobacterales bacterium]